MDVNAVIGYEVFRDILTLLLAVLAVASAVAITVMYAVLSEALKRGVTLAAKTEMHKAIVSSYISMGHLYWKEYHDTKSDSKLNQAIEITERANDKYARELDEQDRESEWLICWIKNNLAYYYAEKQKLGSATLGDKASAQEFVKYVCDRIEKCPKSRKERNDWVDTYKFVRKQFSLNNIKVSKLHQVAQKIFGMISH